MLSKKPKKYLQTRCFDLVHRYEISQIVYKCKLSFYLKKNPLYTHGSTVVINYEHKKILFLLIMSIIKFRYLRIKSKIL